MDVDFYILFLDLVYHLIRTEVLQTEITQDLNSKETLFNKKKLPESFDQGTYTKLIKYHEEEYIYLK